jgi:hypothetical protein
VSDSKGIAIDRWSPLAAPPRGRESAGARTGGDDHFVACFHAQRRVLDEARRLERRLQPIAPERAAQLHEAAEQLRRGAQRALGAVDERAVVRAWLDCQAAERRVRGVTFRALARGLIANADYDRVFWVAAAAAEARGRQLERMRQRLRLLAVI